MAVALIVAAGTGERLGADRPKALVELAGRPLLQWSVDVLLGAPAIERVIVALPDGVQAPAGTIGVRGGAVRSASVRLALGVDTGGLESDLVLVHDAARPLLSSELIVATLAAMEQRGVDAAIAATAVTDTIKRVNETSAQEGDQSGSRAHSPLVADTLDRSTLWAVQTPQVFRRGTLERALDVSDDVLAQATDDAWLVERAGGRVVVVNAPKDNLKVTTPLDLALAELLVARRVEPGPA